jgi:hypothetical protein
MALGVIAVAILTACGKNGQNTSYGIGDYQLSIEPGEAWHHTFYAMGFIPIENEPQMAIWLEDTCGNFLSTVYVTERSATQGWRMAGGARRPEALPRWSHRRGIAAPDGLYMPTADAPEAATGATPHGSFTACFATGQSPAIVYAEINHSADFNQYYTAEALPGTPSYSGGKEGSGQPAIVYSAPILGEDSSEITVLKPIGHSSPCGSDGLLRTSLDSITSALDIVSRISLKRVK